MRYILLITGFLLSSPLLAQWETRPIAPSAGSLRSEGPTEILPAIALPFWDDFSVSGETPGDLWEFSDGIFVNETLGLNAPSYKVATFDGINAAGQIYDESELYPGLTDQLVSRRIDLSSYTGDASLYLSFFWEMGGNGERPENSGDSLRLQFLNSDSVWVTQWKRQATQVNVTDAFAQSILLLTPAYLHANFRFKFESFGSQQGPFDTWHVDYVYLNNGRTIENISYKDRTLTSSITNLFHPYSSLPASHFFINPFKYLDSLHLQGFNLDTTDHNLILNYEIEITNTGEKFTLMEDDYSFLPNITGPLINIKLLEPTIPPKFPAPDSAVLITRVSSNFNDSIDPIPYSVNDSLTLRTNLYDYYAYDDGTAEYTAGVRQNGTVAMRYVLETKDTLTHIDIHFPTTTPSAVGKVLTFKVWKDLEENPVASKSYTIAASGKNEFIRIALNPAVIVQDTIYIGYTQKSADYVGIGLDRSNVSANDQIFYRISGEWKQNEELNGVLMIRAVFEDGASLVLGTRTRLSDLVIYPNPSTGIVAIQGDYKEVKVLSLDGKLVHHSPQKSSHDFSFLPTGVYLLEVTRPDQTTALFKFVKK